MKICGDKFQPLCFELGVAFEVTFSKQTEIKFNSDFAFPQLMRRSDKGTTYQVYLPSLSQGDLAKEKRKEITFIFWVDPEEVLFYRLVFRIKTRGNIRNNFREVVCGRRGEEKPFYFNTRDFDGYISLAFLRDGERFNPLYFKVSHNNNFLSYKVEAGVTSDDQILVSIEEVDSSSVPKFLI